MSVSVSMGAGTEVVTVTEDGLATAVDAILVKCARGENGKRKNQKSNMVSFSTAFKVNAAIAALFCLPNLIVVSSYLLWNTWRRGRVSFWSAEVRTQRLWRIVLLAP